MLSLFLTCWIFFATGLGVGILSLVALVEGLFSQRPTVVLSLLRLLIKVVLVFHRVEVTGLKHISKNSPQIIYSNHQGNMDIFLLAAVLDIPYTWLAKESLFRVPVFGWLLKKLGYIPVMRGRPKEAYKAITDGILRLKEGQTVIIFPEGTWSLDPNHILPFKSGFYNLASGSQVPIIPAKISGSSDVNPPDTYKVRLGTLKLSIAPAILPVDYESMDKATFLSSMRQALVDVDTGNQQ